MNERINWTELREFAGIDLEASYVLSWSMERELLLLDLDVQLLPDHPFYEVPRPSQKVCIRAATIEFPYCESITIEGGDGESSPESAVTSLGSGRIDGLSVVADGQYELRGEFGNVQITAERPLLRLKEL
ncbi:MAG: hypothetical protein QNJ19_10320 [Woeseiaceae bacterium]|nr:hypothetical protein [Woeseiaceae bacterium]